MRSHIRKKVDFDQWQRRVGDFFKENRVAQRSLATVGQADATFLLSRIYRACGGASDDHIQAGRRLAPLTKKALGIATRISDLGHEAAALNEQRFVGPFTLSEWVEDDQDEFDAETGFTSVGLVVKYLPNWMQSYSDMVKAAVERVRELSSQRSVGNTKYLATAAIYLEQLTKRPRYRCLADLLEAGYAAFGENRDIDAPSVRRRCSRFRHRQPQLYSYLEESVREYVKFLPQARKVNKWISFDNFEVHFAAMSMVIHRENRRQASWRNLKLRLAASCNGRSRAALNGSALDWRLPRSCWKQLRSIWSKKIPSQGG